MRTVKTVKNILTKGQCKQYMYSNKCQTDKRILSRGGGFSRSFPEEGGSEDPLWRRDEESGAYVWFKSHCSIITPNLVVLTLVGLTPEVLTCWPWWGWQTCIKVLQLWRISVLINKGPLPPFCPQRPKWKWGISALYALFCNGHKVCDHPFILHPKQGWWDFRLVWFQGGAVSGSWGFCRGSPWTVYQSITADLSKYWVMFVLLLQE